MKLRSLWTLSGLILLLAFVPAASARSQQSCSSDRLAGEWGYTKTGTLYLPTGVAAPFGSVGTFILDAGGNVAGTQLASVAGSVSAGDLYGTFTIDPDCTGTMAVGIYDQSGHLLRTVEMSLVVDDKARELRALITSLTLPNDVALPAVITGEARRLFPNGGDQD